jgi:hypothetical protein
MPTYLGSSYGGGSDFYGRKAEQAGQALRMFVDSLHQRRAEKEARDQQEIASAFEAIQSMPELADTLGADLARRHGQKHPEIGPILAAIRDRYRLQQEVPAAGKRFEDLWGQKEADYAAQNERVARMPDTLEAPAPFDPFAIGPLLQAPQHAPLLGAANPTIQLPNPDKAAAQRALSQVRPELFPRDAWQGLTPHERLAALPYLKNKGYQLPEQTLFDPFGHLSEKSRGMLAVEEGLIPAESKTAQIIRGEGGLELTPEEKAKQDFEVQERMGREAAQKTQREEIDRLAKERLRFADDLRAAADRRNLAGQKELIDYRTSKRPTRDKEDAGVPWKAVVSDSKAAVDDWDERHKTALSGLEGSERKKAEDAFLKANGRRPTAIGEVAARRIARTVRERKLTGADADEAIVSMSSAYMVERAKGTPDAAAIKKAVGTVPQPQVKPPPPGGEKPQQLFSEVKDQQARQWASAEYAARIAAGAAPDEAKAAVDALLKKYGKR